MLRMVAVSSVKEFILHWKKALTGPLVTICLLAYQQYKGKSPTWAWFLAVIVAGLAWQLWDSLSAERAKSLPKELPRLYLFFDPNAGRGVLGYSGHTGLFLRTENDLIASKVRISSNDTVSDSRKILRIRWTSPGQNVGNDPVPVKFSCVTVSNGIESTFNSIDADQLPKFFDHKREQDPAELIVTLAYTNVFGLPCPERKFKIWRDTDPVRTLLVRGRISCDPIEG
jgi:hypothetical protein